MLRHDQTTSPTQTKILQQHIQYPVLCCWYGQDPETSEVVQLFVENEVHARVHSHEPKWETRFHFLRIMKRIDVNRNFIADSIVRKVNHLE